MSEISSKKPKHAHPRQKTSRIAADNIERILNAALLAFAESSLKGARIEQVAKMAGMSKTNLLYYFPSKEALYLAALKHMLDIWLKPLRSLDAASEPATSLSNYITQKLDYSLRYPQASRLFAQEILQGAPYLKNVLEGELADLMREKSQIISGWIAAGKLTPIDPVQLLFAIWATTQHYADFAAQISAITGQSLHDKAFCKSVSGNLVRLILNGVLPR